MKFNKVQKIILVVEIVAIISGGGILAFIPAKPKRPPKIASQNISIDTSVYRRNPVEILSAAEKAELEEILKVDLNTATVDEIMNIPRCGPATAAAIVAYREEHGPFKSFEELDAIPRIGPSIISIITKYARLSGVDTAVNTKRDEGQGIDLNKATIEEITTVPGIGVATAEKIIAARPFKSVEDLKNVPGIGEAKFEKWKTYFRVTSTTSEIASTTTGRSSVGSSSGKINLNSATIEELEKIPSIGHSTARAIIEYREKAGGFKSIEELDNVPRIGPATIEKIRPYVTL